MATVVVLGGGISGLAVAELLRDTHDVTVLEASDRAGGNIATDEVGGCLAERAANGFLDNEPAILRLAERIGLTDELVKAEDGERYIFVAPRLVPLPAKPPQIVASPILTPLAKLRAGLDLVMPRGPDDESVASFVRRRLGAQPLQRLVGPMVSGVYAGDPEALSLPACFPKMKAMEVEHRSLLLAAKARKAKGFGPPGKLHSFERGMGSLIERLVERNPVTLGTAATAVERRGEGWVVHTADGSHEADVVVATTPAWATAELLAPIAPAAAKALADIPYAPISVAVSAYDTSDWAAPTGFGALVPRGQGVDVLGTLFTSSIFPTHAPEGRALLRTMVGGALAPQQAGFDEQTLNALVDRDQRTLLGHVPDPVERRIHRHPRGIPQYTLGHLGRVATALSAEADHPGLFLAGAWCGGVGVKDCARTAERAAARVEAWANG